MANASIGPSSPSLEQFLQFIATAVSAHFERTGSAVNGTWLAEKVRHSFPNFTYTDLGLAKLSEAVALAESRGLVVRNRSVKHLEVLPPNAITKAKLSVERRTSHSVHVRADVWRAFVFVSPIAQFFDREQSRIVDAEIAERAGDPSRYVKIPQIPLETQQDWMREFVEARAASHVSEAPISDPYCFIKFPEWLRGVHAGLERGWKAFRLRRVVDLVREWAQEHAIPTASLFSVPLSPATNGTPAVEPTSDEQEIRTAVIAALNDLPVEKWEVVCTLIRWILRAHNDR